MSLITEEIARLHADLCNYKLRELVAKEANDALRARVTELESTLALVGDMAVGNWDDVAVGRVDSVVKEPQRYKDFLRSMFTAHNRAERLADALRLALNSADGFKKGVRLLEDASGLFMNSAAFHQLSGDAETARSALADQPAQASTQLAALIAAGNTLRDFVNLCPAAPVSEWPTDPQCLAAVEAWDAARKATT